MRQAIVILLIFMMGSAIAAKPNPPLYETQVQATGAEPQDQPRLIQQAFKDLLIQLSGSEKILTRPAIHKALLEVDKYVTQFSYPLSASQERFLRVRFDEDLVNQLIQSVGQPILSRKQSSVVVWLVTQQEDHTQWIEDELRGQWQTLATQRGLPLVFPLLDLTDTILVSETSVWSEDLAALQAAAKRYNTDRYLIGKLSKQPSGWYTQWVLVTPAEPLRWENSYSSAEALVGGSLEDLVAHLVQAESNPAILAVIKTIQLSVSGVSGVGDYTKVLDYLKHIPQVKEVEVMEITPVETIFTVRATADQEQLTKSIELSQLLVQTAVSQPDRLYYKIAAEETE